ncbi:MAG TPA: transcriptional regulator [Cyanobacteria bacterium UBA8803]|nr:transcriptional regulator [Cyanobacteria bacterium UBA9273]HBL59584.1 transcriptional regulator [Cyanobacteria bacterium UBA8803]
MNTLLNRRDYLGTSTGEPMRTQVAHRPIAIPVFPATSETTSSEPISDWDLLIVSERTTSGLTLSSQPVASTEATRSALNELRQLSGLTWEQLARLFNVSRRSLHFWASGQPLYPSNEERLNRLLGTVRYINRGSASINRSILLSPSSDGRIPLDLLIAGWYEEVKQLIGSGNTPQKSPLKPLSEDAIASRMPQKPEELVDALHDPIHREVGRSRTVRAVRSRKRDSNQ